MSEASVVKREGFTGELWRSIEAIYAEILAHPFLQGLTDGTLPGERFRFYVLQDTFYLREYARTLSLTGVRSPDEDALVMFNEHSAGAITVERSLHEGFLLKTATLGDYPEVLGAVLPCYWIYWEVGKALIEQGSPNPRCQKWIDTYGSEDFGALVEAVLDLTDFSFRTPRSALQTLSSEVVPAGEVLDRLAVAQEDHALFCRLPDHGDRHLRLGRQSLYDLLRGGHEELVVLAAGGCQDLRVTTQRVGVLPGVDGDG